MARTNLSGPAKEEYFSSDVYKGTAEQLLETGLVRREQFPGAPGMAKVAATFYDGVPVKRGANPPRDERYLCVRRVNSRLFALRVGLSKAESQLRTAASEARREREQALARASEARERASRERAGMPTSHDEYRSKTARLLARHLAVHRDALTACEWHGYRFDDATLAAFDAAVASAVEALTNGRTLYSATRQQARIDSIERETVKSDAPLQGFLASMVATAQAAS